MTSYKDALKVILESNLKPKKKCKLKNRRTVSFEVQPPERRKKPLKRKQSTPYKATIAENDEFEVHQGNEIVTESYTNLSKYNNPLDGKHKAHLVKKVLDFDVRSDSLDNCSMKMQCGADEWVKETDWTMSPSTSEFSTSKKKVTDWITSSCATEFVVSKKKQTDWTMSPSATEFPDVENCFNTHQEEQVNVSNLTNISVEYNDTPHSDLSHIFDYTSSDSSSSSSDIENYINLLPKDVNYSSISEKKSVEEAHCERSVVEEAHINNPLDEVDEGFIYQNVNANNEDLYNNIVWEVPGGCIILLNRNSPLYFHGAFVMSVLYGEVDLLGHTLTPNRKEVEVYSLRGSSYLFFENKCNKHECKRPTNIESVLTDLQVESDVLKNVSEKWSPSVTIIFCKVLVSQRLQFLEKHVAQQLLPKPTAHELLCTFRTDLADWNVLRINDYWEELAGQIDANSRVILCGGKGVGKSTLLRFLINRLLMTHAKVLVIDLDPGQPEFTVSGCISASVVVKPVFGPNYTHLQIPEKCVFVKNINISYDPGEYLNCVVELMNACTDLSTNVPTIVNYMGFSRGIGLNLISSVIPLVSPTTVVQIQSAKRQRNFPQNLSLDTIKTYSKLLDLNLIEKVSLCYNLIVLESMTDDYEGWQMEPRIVRELGVLSYFSEMLGPSNFCLTNHLVPMYKVNLSNICIMSGEIINAAASINANMVALCSISKTANILKCYGWGIVRGVDTDSNELYLLTPLAPNELENVTHLALGSVNLPPAIYMAQEDKVGLVPYVSLGLITDFNSIPKRSHLHKNTYASNNVSG